MKTQRLLGAIAGGMIACALTTPAHADTNATLALPASGGEAASGALVSVDSASGAASASYMFDLLTARGDVQPSLGLSYSSSAGVREAGLGWGLSGLHTVERRHPSGARGAPTHVDPTAGPTGDRFYFDDNPLVPICVVGSGPCSPSASGAQESLPGWTTGWVYFRMEVDRSFARFFWSPDAKTFVVQLQSGETMELGAPREANADARGLVYDEFAVILRWNLVRRFDSHGTTNPVVYEWDLQDDRGRWYLTDIYDTPTDAKSRQYAHRTHLDWDDGDYVRPSFSPRWYEAPRKKLKQVVITSATLTSASREFVRRYSFGYHQDRYNTLLLSVQKEGRCNRSDQGGIPEVTALAGPTACPTMPATTFEYPTRPLLSWQQPRPFPTAQVSHVAGAVPVPSDKPVLLDVTNDGLPDFVVPPKVLGHPQTLYVAYIDGTGQLKYRLDAMGLHGGSIDPRFLSPDYANNVIFGNFRDGSIDVIWHDQGSVNYSVYSPFFNSGNTPRFTWSQKTNQGSLPPEFAIARPATPGDNSCIIGCSRGTPAQTGPDEIYGDVNMDGLVDVVSSWTANFLTTRDADGTIHPFATPVPHPSETLHYQSGPVCDNANGNWITWTERPERMLADMNADGILDRIIVGYPNKARCTQHAGKSVIGNPNCGFHIACDVCANGDRVPACDVWEYGTGNGGINVTVYPGLGNGAFGAEYVANLVDPNGATDYTTGTDFKFLSDVNDDGFADAVVTNDYGVAVFYGQPLAGNRDAPGGGTGSELTYFIGTADFPLGYPTGWDKSKCSVYASNLDGSGSSVVALCPNGLSYANLSTPVNRLKGVRNGLGAKTTITYASTVDYPQPTRGSPQPMQLVKSVAVTNGLSGAKAESHSEEYTYASPVFDMLTARFVGFGETTVRPVGTGLATATHTKRIYENCTDDLVRGPCARTVDRPFVAVQGLTSLIEKENVSSTGAQPSAFLSSEHFTHEVTTLLQGMDGRKVRFSYVKADDTYLYETSPFTYAPTTTSLSSVEAAASDGTTQSDNVQIWSQSFEHVRTRVLVDGKGNETDRWDDGRVGVDAVVHISQTWQPFGADQWWYRVTEIQTDDGTGQGGTTGIRHSRIDYNDNGDPKVVQGWLVGIQPLERYHENPSALTAPNPTNASTGGWIALATYSYDQAGFGHVVHVAGPNGHCVDTAYDPLFSQVAVSDTIYAGVPGGQTQGCGSHPFQMTRTIDRGLEKVTMSIAATSAITLKTYDGFGRLVEAMRPSNVPHVTQKFDYFEGPTVQQIHASTSLDGATFSDAVVLIDGFGKPVLKFLPADPNANDGGKWIVTGLPDHDSFGRVVRSYQPGFYSGDPYLFSLSANTSSFLASSVDYDTWGRTTQAHASDGAIVARTAYHALSTEAYDERQVALGLPPTRTFRDGHGRVWRNERQLGGDVKDNTLRIDSTYLTTGELATVDQYKLGSSDPHIVRSMQYDTFGRMVRNVEPNTTTTTHGSVRSWRYAYDDSGDLVGTSDARGCGKNLFYESLGRLVAEDFSPCLDSQPKYTSVQVASGVVISGDGTETYNVYDMPEGGEPDADFGGSWDGLRGKLVATYDRASHTRFAYDIRGRGVGVSRQIAAPGEPDSSVSNRYATWWYHSKASYDDNDRLSASTTGADAHELLVNGASATAFTYSARGVTTRVDSSYGVLTQNPVVDAVGFVHRLDYGDGASTTALFTPDARYRVKQAMISRWIDNPDNATRQMVLSSHTYDYTAGALTNIKDGRLDSEWQDGAKPVSRAMGYDALGQLTSVKYEYAGGQDRFVPPFQAESQQASGGYTPFVKASARVKQQVFDYDWRGNLIQSTDDANVFWDRGFGHANYNSQALVDAKPNQLFNTQGATGGSVDVQYDPAGNVVDIIVMRDPSQCTDTGACSHRFRYDWDETGRLSRARRWDFGRKGVDPNWNPHSVSYPSAPTQDPLADLTFAYDSRDNRVLKSNAVAGSTWTDAEIFGSLRLDHTTFDTGTRDYDHSAMFESVYLAGIGRLVYVPGETLRVFLELSNHLGSTAVVIDKETGELVERITYLAYGGTESDYRPQKWNSFRERYRLTGKEEEHDVGLTYFGARYYIAPLGRWASADPLTVHSLGADLNPYAYVSGSPLSRTDPRGLTPCPQDGPSSGGGGGGGGGGGSAPPKDPPPSGGGSADISSGRTHIAGEKSDPCANDFGFEDDSIRFENKPDISEKFMAYDPWASSNWLDQSINRDDGWLSFLQNDGALETAQNVAAGAALLAASFLGATLVVEAVSAGVAAIGSITTFEGGVATVVVNGSRLGGLVVDVMATESGLATGGTVLVGGGVLAGEKLAANAASRGGSSLPTLIIDSKKMPNIAENIRHALAAGHPEVLTRGAGTQLFRDTNRAAALGFIQEEGVVGFPGMSWDEFPFASVVEGGPGSWVGVVPLAEQRIQGGVINGFFLKNGIKAGDAFRVVVH